MATTEQIKLVTDINQLLPALSTTLETIRSMQFPPPDKAMGEMLRAMDGVSHFDSIMASVKTARDKVQTGLERVGKQLQDTGRANFALNGVDNMFISAARSAMDFESQMVGLRRTVDFDTPQQFTQMGEDILGLSDRLPVAAGDMVRLVQAAEQAGIARDELATFTEDAVKMGTAFGQTAEQSVVMLADWRSAFGLTQEQAVLLGDKITALSGGGGAGGQQIAGILSAVGPLAAGASEQVAALGATLVGVGVQQDSASAGIASFMQALTAGGDASERQQAQFTALGLSAKSVAAGMQQDAAGTIQQVLGALSGLDAAGRSSALEGLFGSESAGAITPLIDNLALLEMNLATVSDSTRYSGAMQQIWEQQTATTAAQIQLLSNQASHMGIAIGNALLPQINAGTQALMPMMGAVTAFITANPGMVRALAGAAAGFAVLRMATTATSVAMGIMSSIASMSPVGLIVRGIAMAAGLIAANWETVGPVFKMVWDLISPLFEAGWEVMQTVFSWSPLGLIINNWGPIVAWFKGLWATLRPIFEWVTGEKAQMVSDLNAEQWAPGGTGIYGTGVPSQGYNPYQIQPSSAAGPAGSLTVDFVNAPPGMRVTDTRSEGLNVDHNVGYTLYNQSAQALSF